VEWQKLWKIKKREFRNFCVSPIIIWIINSRSLKWEEQVACVGERRNADEFLPGSLRRENMFKTLA
jgi:hypothetical protein